MQSRTAYKRVMALAPDDPEAREALGYVNVNGKWLTEEEGYRARGYVRYEGEWLTPAEVQAAQASAAKDQARDDAARRAADAEFNASMDRIRAKEEKSAQQSKEFMEFRGNDPVYWGGWGYGVSTWPGSASTSSSSGGAK